MYGTNDLEHVSARVFSHDLRRIVKRTVMAGTIPVLSTIPPRLDSRRLADRVPRLNRAIASIAETGHLPLWNYWRQLQAPGLANHGMDDDGMHPNVFRGDESTDLTARGLRYGYNQRNLGSLRVLEHLRRSVLAG